MRIWPALLLPILLLLVLSLGASYSEPDKYDAIREQVLDPVIVVRIDPEKGLFGSGVVFKTSYKDGEWETLVLSARHLFYDRTWVPEPLKAGEDGFFRFLSPSHVKGKWVWTPLDLENLSVVVFDHVGEKEFTYPAELLHVSDQELDVAVLRFHGPGIGVAEALLELPKEFQETLSVGSSLDAEDVPAPTKGIISIARSDREKIVSTAQLYFGYSGGGLFVEHEGRWKLVGINTEISKSGGTWVWHYASATPTTLINKWLQTQGLNL